MTDPSPEPGDLEKAARLLATFDLQPTSTVVAPYLIRYGVGVRAALTRQIALAFRAEREDGARGEAEAAARSGSSK